LWLLCTLAPGGVGAQGQNPASSAYLDAEARTLYAVAREAHLQRENEVLGYTALVRERAGASLRLPLRDRSLYRAERASRVFWSRDGGVLVQLLGASEWEPGSTEGRPDASFSGGSIFDPSSRADRLTLGLIYDDEEDAWFHHPLGRDAETHYRFRTGDSLALTLADGRRLDAVELQVLPRAADFRRISGSLWIEPESGALVRAVYRMSERLDVEADLDEGDTEDLRYVPGLFRPFTAEFTLATVDYVLWDFRVWLPRSMRIEGVMSAGVVRVPAAAEISYRLESVVLRGDLAQASDTGGLAPPEAFLEERHFRTRSEAMAYLAELMGEEGGAFAMEEGATLRSGGRTVSRLLPVDSSALVRSPELPPAIWEEAPGFASDRELRELMGVLAGLPAPEPEGVRWAFNWGYGRPDLLRYNRVEGPAVGARLEMLTPSPVGPLMLRLQPFLGISDLDPKVRLSVAQESLRRRLSVGVYRELEPVSPRRGHLGPGNSVSALFFGRDEGEYFMSAGAEVRVTPPSARRQSWELRLYTERHDPVESNNSFSLAHAFDGDWRFRPNVEAERRSEVGASLLVSPWWGTDPLAPQGGVELFAHGAAGDGEYGRAALTLRGAAPLFGRLALGGELGAGESWGALPIQRSWFLGGSHTLRGYDASTLAGPSFVRGRVEVQRVLGAVGVAFFGDGGWTGDGLEAFRESDALFSAGAGLSLLGGVVRLDIARALRDPRGFRLHLYLDGIF
jgi:hypothetical protein